jgi:hypothetical protein
MQRPTLHLHSTQLEPNVEAHQQVGWDDPPGILKMQPEELLELHPKGKEVQLLVAALLPMKDNPSSIERMQHDSQHNILHWHHNRKRSDFSESMQQDVQHDRSAHTPSSILSHLRNCMCSSNTNVAPQNDYLSEHKYTSVAVG